MPLFPKRRYVRFVPSGRASLNMNWYLASLAEFGGPLLTAELVEQRLRIERFEVARPARHVEENDRLRLRIRQMRRARGQRIAPCADLLVVQQREERKAAEAAEGGAEEVAAGARLEEHSQTLG